MFLHHPQHHTIWWVHSYRKLTNLRGPLDPWGIYWYRILQGNWRRWKLSLQDTCASQQRHDTTKEGREKSDPQVEWWVFTDSKPYILCVWNLMVVSFETLWFVFWKFLVVLSQNFWKWNCMWWVGSSYMFFVFGIWTFPQATWRKIRQHEHPTDLFCKNCCEKCDFVPEFLFCWKTYCFF